MKKERPITERRSAYDVGIVIALDEEFRHFELVAAQRLHLIPGPKLEEPAWEFEFVTKNGDKRRGLVTVCNEMGPLKALDLAHSLLTQYSFKLIINAGTSGALQNHLRIGDIIIGRDQIIDYSHRFKIIDSESKGSSYELQLGSRSISISNDAAIGSVSV